MRSKLIPLTVTVWIYVGITSKEHSVGQHDVDRLSGKVSGRS